MTDSKQTIVLNVTPTIDQINADRITQVFILHRNNKKSSNNLKQYL